MWRMLKFRTDGDDKQVFNLHLHYFSSIKNVVLCCTLVSLRFSECQVNSTSGGASQPLLVGHKCVTGEHRLLNWGILTLMRCGTLKFRWGTGPTWPHPRTASELNYI